MSEKEPTQHTPKGAEIPVPKRDQVMRDFEKITKPLPPEKARRKRRAPRKP